MIDDFIEEELSYFEPMLKRIALATDELRKTWRAETVGERLNRVSTEVHEICNGVVKYGPFRGLKLDKKVWWGQSDLGSQLLGLYEKEILDFFDMIEPGKFSSFVDLGAADGYYAVGALHTGKFLRSVCYEVSFEGQSAIKRNWKSNGAPGELLVRGEANSKTLLDDQITFGDDTLVLIDIEGGEFDILTDDVLKHLRSCEIIVEIHNWVPDFKARYSDLLRRIASIFDVSIVNRVERPTVNIPELRSFTDDNRLLVTSERRPCLMRFLRLHPRL